MRSKSKKTVYKFSLIYGLLLTLAAFPVFAQNGKLELNKRPLLDLGKFVLEKVQKKEVDLKSPFSLRLQGRLNADGRFDVKTTKFTKSEGDQEIIEIAKQAIEAVNDSGIFIYLKQLGLNEIEISLAQTDKDFSANLKSTLESANRAKTITSGMNTMFQIGIGNAQSRDDNSKALLEKSKVESVGKDFLLKFSMPLEQFHGIINRELEKVR